MTYMKAEKDMDIIECQKVSHKEARTASFRIKIKGADYDKAMSADSWPYRVRVRVYKHFRNRDSRDGAGMSQFNMDITRNISPMA